MTEGGGTFQQQQHFIHISRLTYLKRGVDDVSAFLWQKSGTLLLLPSLWSPEGANTTFVVEELFQTERRKFKDEGLLPAPLAYYFLSEASQRYHGNAKESKRK